ncbi:TetR family transcriptional regulator [Methylobacterium sp. Leaf456]|uniref:TetR/AcrR family transcriptional regulator n=1 Tax=Methylobacterium sp. Leaf456 TaxID=1736382 RepID=UPI0006F7DF77|nr:TetR/AcrR family transcriptional regulator C-terminal domain-containing protein [Methylobacterium sp. Leaf456]KQT50113.1 TetR family transcriptional regulator [Methylobacterium sp. Leaf456]
MSASAAILDTPSEPPSLRQQAVLDAVLSLIVEGGDPLTMDAVARRASCSKETLYKWFGDRDGLLNATVRWQASRVHAGRTEIDALDAATLNKNLRDFAESWLSVIASPTSVALNRIAVAHAGSHKSNLGAIVLANGRVAIGARVKPVLEAGRAAGLLAFEDTEAAFRTFFGLVGRDIQIRLLLGDALPLDAAGIGRDAAQAVEQFLALYGRANP